MDQIDRSLKLGTLQKAGNQHYMGSPPVYGYLQNPVTGVVGLYKVKPGVPFVRIDDPRLSS